MLLPQQSRKMMLAFKSGQNWLKIIGSLTTIHETHCIQTDRKGKIKQLRPRCITDQTYLTIKINLFLSISKFQFFVAYHIRIWRNLTTSRGFQFSIQLSKSPFSLSLSLCLLHSIFCGYNCWLVVNSLSGCVCVCV